MAIWIAVILGALLVLTNGFWFYSATDLAVTEKYRQQEGYEAEKRIEALESLCDRLVAGMPKAEAVNLLNELSPKFEAYEKDGQIHTIWLSLQVNEQGHIVNEKACR